MDFPLRWLIAVIGDCNVSRWFARPRSVPRARKRGRTANWDGGAHVSARTAKCRRRVQARMNVRSVRGDSEDRALTQSSRFAALFGRAYFAILVASGLLPIRLVAY